MKLRHALITATLLLTGFAPVQAAEPSEFRQALNALEKKELGRFNSLRQDLSDHPLQGYLDYRFLLARLDQSDPKTIKHFLGAWGDTPWGKRLQHRWLLHQGKKKRWDALLAAQKTPPKSIELQCYYYRAKAQQIDQRSTALRQAEQLWLSGDSRPEACDPLFANLKKEGRITPELINQRFKLAFAAGNLSLMRYLHKLGGGKNTPQSQLIALHQNPQQLAKTPLALDKPNQRRATTQVLKRWLRQDAPAAIAHWQKIAGQFNEAERAQFEIYAARYLLARYRFEPKAWLDNTVARYSPQSQELRQLGLRAALAQGDWQTVATLGKDQEQSYFRYWRLRALDELGRISKPGLSKHLDRLAGERSFYGYQAAALTAQPFAPQSQHTSSNPARIERVAALPRFKRVEAFIDEGLNNEARAEWEYLLSRLNSDALAAAAQLAKERQWAYFGIRNAVKGGFFDDLELRFPLVYRSQIHAAAQKRALESSLVFAIARQESAFWPKARSHVGARGLMQLMPATARETAKRWDLPLGNLAELYQPETNLLLGSSYLAGLLERFEGDIARAAAAYNAGPHRVSRWDKARGDLPLDAWIETIPFKETRHYVQNILVYKAIYQLRQQQQQLALSEPDQQKQQSL